MGRPFPRLLFIGDVPVTDSMGGAAYLFRLLSAYPAERLVVICPMYPGMNVLAGVRYHHLGARFPRLLRTRLSGLYCSWLTLWYYQLPRAVRRVAEAFRPEATLSVSHAGGWLVAWRLAEELKIPFHIISHDDHAYSMHLPARLKPWAERKFAAAYRSARSRLCISPAMAEAYEQRYCVPGQVIYPMRDPDNPVFAEVAPRTLATKSTLTFAFAGSLHGKSSLREIVAFARAANECGHRLLVYTPQHASLEGIAGTGATGLDVRPPIGSSSALILRLRDEADVLLVTGSFDPLNKAVVSTLFPSKLADYSAVGLPVLVWAPPYASIARFVRENPGAAESITNQDPESLRGAMNGLAASPARREALGEAMLALGRRYFAPEAAFESFQHALTSTDESDE